jgi:ATP-dependent DNA ligase
MVFDLLFHDRRDLTDRPLRDRRTRVEDVVAGSELASPLAAAGAERPRGVEAGSRARV